MSTKATKDTISHRASVSFVSLRHRIAFLHSQFLVIGRADFISREEREDFQEGGAAT
jgi:hypothetical protein